ncbi:gamma-glutamyltransferase [Caballeronia hypogeia]|uniref:Gamma-glutamyltransferase n=1 Tax=Caballeronia hypogeia TaxID=1777140 RepID=A0A158ACQ8_9BURK|nr:gamma-glutamyltransferase [Caballeronia hypogeia]SAK54867.1 gamma-glutamyltransferase [Caballeronia hypogeia]
MTSFVPSSFPVNYSTVHKPSVVSSKGIVASQVYDASAAGVAILAAGGNAVDAAVATAFALAVVEPWNSGLGGIGFALVHRVEQARASSIHFGPVAPMAVSPDLFPLTGRPGNDIFPWPQVENDANAHGPKSFCLPTAVAGYGTMLERFGTMPLRDVLQPAIELAKRGLALDWFTTLMLAQAAPLLRKYETSAQLFLRDGLPPVPPYQGVPGFLKLGNLTSTLERIAQDGWRDFYQGGLAADIVADIASMGGVISNAELAKYEPEIRDCLSIDWKGSQIQLSSGLTAGPTLADTFERLKDDRLPDERGNPSGAWYLKLAKALKAAYAQRLESAGDDEPKGLGCTTHISVSDATGNMVSMTSTLLSSMGSRVTLPKTGFVMNNGLLWFDPRPGNANSVGPAKRPLTNMCPAIVAREGKPIIVGGAAGGRRIMASVAQLLLFVHDLGMDVERAGHWPRIDVSGPDLVSIDRRLPSSVVEVLSELGDTEVVDHDVLPINFARPSIIDGRDLTQAVGISDVRSPWSAALAPSVE